MTIHVALDGIDWGKAHHQQNVDACNKLLALLDEHHGGGEPIITAPIEAAAPEPIHEPDTTVVTEPEPVNIETEDRDWLFVRPPAPSKIRAIQIIVAKHYGLKRSDLVSARRTARLAKARQVAMYLSKSVALKSLPEIGRRFGGRDHTTVLHGVRKIGNLIDTDEAFRAEIDDLKAQFEAAR